MFNFEILPKPVKILELFKASSKILRLITPGTHIYYLFF